ncbi:MAG: SDR family oxidoreductase [Pseudomonadales bacterium]
MSNSTTLLTGATGGIGRAIAAELNAAGESLLLIGRCESRLKNLQRDLRQANAQSGGNVNYCVADINRAEDRQCILRKVQQHQQPVTRLINNAGVNAFAMFEDQSADSVQDILNTNAVAPIQLIRILLPYFLAQQTADIVNIGSTFGSIGYPGFSSYSASKFALRGFTEALSREYENSGLQIRYFAPRATKTDLNCSHVEQMNEQLNVNMDCPKQVARELAAFINSEKRSAAVGWPEKGFARLNQLFPSLVGHFIQKDFSVIHKHAKASITA